MRRAAFASSQVAGATIIYREGRHFGYRGYERAGVTPLFGFGHGVGYGKWTYSKGRLESVDNFNLYDPEAIALWVYVTVRHSAPRAAREVVQIYAAPRVNSSEDLPKILVGFMSVEVGAGQTIEVKVPVSARSLACYKAGGWELEAGERRLQISRSAVDVRMELIFQSS